MTLTGIVGRPDGQIVPLVNTTKRSKRIDISSYVTGSGWTSTRGQAIFYADSNGVWRLRANISGNTSSAVNAITLTFSGFSFKATAGSSYQAVSAYLQRPAYDTPVLYAAAFSSNVAIQAANSDTFNSAHFFLDAELTAEPTWSSLGTTWAQVAEAPGDVAAYIPMADAATAGMVSTANQTFGGRKSAGNSKVRASLTASATSIPASTETEIVFNNDSASGINCDINGEFNTSTGRFTATRAGWYLVTVALQMAAVTSGKYWAVNLYKNGTGGFRFSPNLEVSSSGMDLSINTMGLVYLNGTTDYVSAFVYQNDTVAANLYGHVSHNSSHIVIVELV